MAQREPNQAIGERRTAGTRSVGGEDCAEMLNVGAKFANLIFFHVGPTLAWQRCYTLELLLGGYLYYFYNSIGE